MARSPLGATFTGAALRTKATEHDTALNNLDAVLVNVRAYGATGDGTTDDTAALQAALTAGAGGTVIFGPGTFRISAVLRVPTGTRVLAQGATITVPSATWTGGAPFYGVFSTVAIVARPQTVLWRLGTGTVAYRDILIDGFTFNLNRSGSGLSSGQMAVSDFNAVRFEDAESCTVRGCRFIDTQTSGNKMLTQVVFLVRSNTCVVEDCYFENCGGVYVPESTRCIVRRNRAVPSPGTAFETVGGSGHVVEDNYVSETWSEVSNIGVNSTRCRVRRNTIGAAGIAGIVLGHDVASSYSTSAAASYTVCSENVIESGSSNTSGSGYNGILVQNGANVRVDNNTILGLRKGAAYTEFKGAIMVQGSAGTAAYANFSARGNTIESATNGIIVRAGDDFKISDNCISDVLCGYYSPQTAIAPGHVLRGNTLKDCGVGGTAGRAITIENGYGVIQGNRLVNVTSGSFSVALSRGIFDFSGNTLDECGEVFFGTVKGVRFCLNTFLAVTPKTRAGTVSNSSTAGTATIDLIEVGGNYHPGTTDVLRLTGVLNQSTRTVETTAPRQFRSTSYNVGALPTSSAGLSAGDLWSNAGVVTVA